jgi:probable selenium-dependent hydroxylase accessory protein YqeC
VSQLIELLAASSGLLCAVGAGGKKTTLYHLAVSHPGRVGLTCTVPITRFPPSLDAEVVIADPQDIVDAVVEAAANHRVVAFARPSQKPGRYAGLAPALVDELRSAAGFDVLFVKADGARRRWIKAPNEQEPLIPPRTTALVPIVSARAIGEPLSERIAHRLDRVEAVTGARRGERITCEHLAQLLADRRGALKGAGDASVVPLINMVDDSHLLTEAREAARIALHLSERFDRVVLTSSTHADRLIEVINR